MPSIEDWINNPLGIIQFIFEKAQNFDSKNVQTYFSEKLKLQNAVTWVPSLNDTPLHTLKPNSLVRFRCIVQDMYDPEFYLGAYEVKDSSNANSSLRSGKYKDVAECGANQKIDLESSKNITMDRQTLYCVPVPGETDWVKKGHADTCKVKTRSYPSTSKLPNRCKRSLSEDGMEVEESQGQTTMEEPDLGCADGVHMEESECKRQQKNKPAAGASTGPDLNFPLPGETGLACLVKVYDMDDQMKVNDIVEFVGVLSVDPILAKFQDSEEQSAMMEGEAGGDSDDLQCPPPSLVPRLHAVLCNHHKHVNPLLSPPDTDDYKTVLGNYASQVGDIREELLSILEHCLLGDRLAAEYFLCHLVASVYGRADAMPLGKFSINLSHCPSTSSYSDLLHHLIANLVTQSHLLHMSLENMNKLAFSPHKDYKQNRLCSGLLQLAEQTNLVLDEMALQPGQLDIYGVKNLSALGNAINWQKVEYDFEFHKQDFLCNMSVLILSDGKSILPSDCHIPLQYTGCPGNMREHFNLLDNRLLDDFLTKCRTYLGLARNLDYSLSDDIQKTIQDDFVLMRKEDPKSMTIDDFHTLLSLSRLLALSELKTCPSVDIWNRAKSLESTRKQRVGELPSRQQAS